MKSIRTFLIATMLAASAATASAADLGILSTSLSSVATQAKAKSFWEVVSFTVTSPAEVFAGVGGVASVGSWVLLDASFTKLSDIYSLGSYDIFSLSEGDYLLGINVMPLFAGGFAIASAGIAAAVPEPETYALLLAGIGIIFALSRRRLR